MGEAGSVQSQPVMRKVEASREVVVAVEHMPKEVTVGAPFVAALRVSNNSPRALLLQLQFRRDDVGGEGGIYCASVSRQVRHIRLPHELATVH